MLFEGAFSYSFTETASSTRDGGTDHVKLFNDLIASQMSVQPVFVARFLARLGDTDQTAFRKFWSEMDQSDVVLLKLFMLVRTPNEDMDSLSRTVFDMKACSSEAQVNSGDSVLARSLSIRCGGAGWALSSKPF